MAHDIFISYSSQDKAIADAVCAKLEESTIRCWIAPRDIFPGRPYGEALIDALNESRVMVLIFSSGANSSHQVMREVERAVSKGLPIIPFRIEDVPLSKQMEYFISVPHWLDALTPPLENHIQVLTRTLQFMLSNEMPSAVQRTAEAGIKQSSETPDYLFEKYFGDHPEIIAAVEEIARKSPEEVYSQTSQLLLRIELCLSHPSKGALNEPIANYNTAYFDRISSQLTRFERNLPAAVNLAKFSREYNLPIGSWCDALAQYQKSFGGLSSARKELLKMGSVVAPLICSTFRAMNLHEGHNDMREYYYCWQVEVELANILSQLQYFQALSFIADSLLQEINLFGSDFVLGLARALRRFGVSVSAIDKSFVALFGLTNSEIVSQRK